MDPTPPTAALDPRLAGDDPPGPDDDDDDDNDDNDNASPQPTAANALERRLPTPIDDSFYLGDPSPFTSPDLDAVVAHLQAFARGAGFALVRSSLRRREDRTPTRLNLLCDRHGALRNHRGLTDATRVRKRRASRGLGCPYRIACTLAVRHEDVPHHHDHAEGEQGGQTAGEQQQQEQGQAEGGAVTYRFRVTNAAHNHPAAEPAQQPHWKHRQLGAAEMRLVRRGYVDGQTPREMLRALKTRDPGSLYGLKDVQNARAKARAQFLEFIEGGPPAVAGAAASSSSQSAQGQARG